MLDRQFLSTAGISASEFVQWVAAEKHELTPFEARLFNEAEVAAVISGGDNDIYEAEELRSLIDIGVIAEDHGFYKKACFTRAESVETAASDLISSYNGDAADTLDCVLGELQKAAKNARTTERRAELKDLIERLNDVIKCVDNLDKALNI